MKLIEQIEAGLYAHGHNHDCKGCPYVNDPCCISRLMDDALLIIKSLQNKQLSLGDLR